MGRADSERQAVGRGRTLAEFQKEFPDEPCCAAFLSSRRWPDGFVCPACGKRRAVALKSRPRLLECLDCGRQTSLTAGTAMHRSKLPLTTWFWAAHVMSTHSNGMVEEGFEATVERKYNPSSARPRIFDGAAEAKLIALTCSPAPEGFARWSLRLLEEKVVELSIVDKASDNTIGRTLKKCAQTAPQSAMGDPARRQCGLCRRHGDVLETPGSQPGGREIPIVLSCVWTKPPSN